MQAHSHDSVCVYMCLLIKLLWRAIQHVPWKQGLPWKECFLVDGKRNEDLIPSFSLVLKKDINLCNYWHQQSYSWKTSAFRREKQTRYVHSREFLASGLWWCVQPCISGQLSSYPSHHTQLCSQPPSGTLVTYPSKLCRSQSHNKPQESGFAKLLFLTGSILMQKVPESFTCQIFSLLEYKIFAVIMYIVLQMNEKHESN